MLYYSSDHLDSKTIHAAIAKRLHDERVAHKYTQDGLAETLGYSKPTIISWEKGWRTGSGENRIPTLEQIMDLCALYKCQPGYLLCEFDDKTYQMPDIQFQTGLTPQSVQIITSTCISRSFAQKYKTASE